MTTATRARKNIASLRVGGEGSPKPLGSASLVEERIKLSKVPGSFDSFREDSGDEKTGKLCEITIIKAGVSLNGLDYLPETLKEAAPLFEGVPIYAFKFGQTIGDGAKLSHLPEKAKTGQGNVGNMVAQIKESWWDESRQAIRGLIAVFDEATRTKLRNAFDQKLIGAGVKEPAFGLSIDAAGLKEGAGVTKIVRPESVDMVKKAAAGGGFDRIVAEATEEEDDMKPEEITQLIKDGIVAGFKAREAEDEEGKPKPPAPGGDPLSGLRKMLEGASGDERKAMMTRVIAMFREMGLAEATPEDERSAVMHEEMKKILATEKNPAKLKEAIASLVEAHTPEPQDPTTLKLKEREKQLREMAIGRALDAFKLEDGSTFHCLNDAIKLADLDGVKVKEDYSEVTGLTEALTKLAELKPHLIKKAEVVEVQEGDEGGSGEPKPKPRGQDIHLQEEDGGQGGDVRNIKALEAELATIDDLLTNKRHLATDRDVVRRAKVGSQLKAARASA